MGWDGPILTDSGGFQVMSLAGLVRVDDDGVRFRSHVDGRAGFLRPEDVRRGAGGARRRRRDVARRVRAGRRRRRREVARAVRAHDGVGGARARRATPGRHGAVRHRPGRVRSGAARARAPPRCSRSPFDGYAVGGLSVGEPPEETARVAAATVGLLPADRPRYLMGMGTPRDLLRFAGLGYDLFDCVLPTRNARNGMLFTREGKAHDPQRPSRPRPAAGGRVAARATRAALQPRCLAPSRAWRSEMLGAQLATLHNLHFYLAADARDPGRLAAGTFPARGARGRGRLGLA